LITGEPLDPWEIALLRSGGNQGVPFVVAPLSDLATALPLQSF